MPSPNTLKRKQSVSGESQTLLDFFGTKRPKASPLRPSGRADSDPIVISDDEEYAAESSTTIKPEPVSDLSFTDDEWEAGGDERLVIEDDIEPDVGHTSEPKTRRSSECLGNALLATSGSLGTCTICGLLLLDANEAEINDHIAQCLARPPTEHTIAKPQTPIASSSKSMPPSTRTVSPLKPTASKIVNALRELMSSRDEKEAWDAADEAEASRREAKSTRSDLKGKSKATGPSKSAGANRQRRSAPFYKVLPGMPIAVDAFCYGPIPGVTAYFLSHAHSDHYTNLSSSWKHGPIYCSVTTANLIKFMLRVDPKWVKPLPENESVEIPDTGGVRVTLIDANHCPGSSLFVFNGKQTVNAGDSPVKSPFVGSDRQFTYLHCGDFRACPAHALHPAIRGHRIDIVYLDTTYLSPKALVIDACAELAKQNVRGDKAVKGRTSLPPKQTTVGGWFKPSAKLAAKLESQPSTELVDPGEQKPLVVVGTYTIGKERVLKAIAQALSSKIYCNSRKHAVFMCQADPALHAMLTKDPADAQVHVLPLMQISVEKLTEYLELHRKRHDRILGFRPTGWTYTPPAGQATNPTIEQILAQARAHKYDSSDLRPQRGSNARVTIYGVPYSEHSSFRELTCFALSVDWARMIATVNVGNAASRAKMSVWFDKWARARKERGNAIVEHRSVEYW
ncbi:DNA repair metallo-beta-lactamase [Ceratobasidium sp. AG-Ba]|nr:DNA repair metallo-beta-lactamase [Ceratobasidium sp. AG-Ba]